MFSILATDLLTLDRLITTIFLYHSLPFHDSLDSKNGFLSGYSVLISPTCNIFINQVVIRLLCRLSFNRSSGDLKSCQAVPAGFTQGLSPQSIAMSLSSPVPSQPLHQSQPPNLTLFGTNLQGKVTTPLTHIGMVPSSTLQSAMLHLSRQSREQAGIVLPQNHFNQGN